MRAVASMEHWRMISCSSCRSPPCRTASISRFSVALKGRYSFSVLSTIFSFTCSPSVTFCASRSTASAHRKPSGMEIRRLALSSSVRSIHWAEAVIGAFIASAIRYRAREQIRSLRIGLRLYAMAEDPIWFFSKGSSTWRSCCIRRMSVAMRYALWAMEDRAFRIRLSVFRG